MSTETQESPRVEITKSQLFSAEVDRELARQRALQGRTLPAPAKVGLLRRVLLSSMFYLPLAGLIGALGAWAILEPYIADHPAIAGEVALVNNDPFDARGMVVLTIGGKEVVVDPNRALAFPGPHGEPVFKGLDEITVGTVVEAVGESGGDLEERMHNRFVAVALRRTTPEAAAIVTARAEKSTAFALIVFFPFAATLIGVALLVAEVISRRHYSRLIDRVLAGSALAALFAFLALIPGGIIFSIGEKVLHGDLKSKVALLFFVTCRSIAWACTGAGLGIGMNLTRSTRAELRNSMVGGALGGAFGGVFFDPIAFAARGSAFDHAGLSRVVGVVAIGLAVGVFVALLERLTREAWVRVRTGPLAGKSFVLYRTPTTVGSAPSSDIYLFKDAGIDAHHASFHRVGDAYEIEDQGSRQGTEVAGQRVRRRRLSSGDQIVVGSTVLEFEERARRPQDAAKEKTS